MPATEPLCPYYKAGTCRFGDECRNRHPAPTVKAARPNTANPTVSVAASKGERSWSPKLESKARCQNTAGTSSPAKAKAKAKLSKKPKMRTASDVVQRIIWDEEV